MNILSREMQGFFLTGGSENANIIYIKFYENIIFSKSQV